LTLFIENCGQTAADGDMVTIESIWEVVRWYHCRPFTTYRLVIMPHDFHSIVRYDLSRSSKVNYYHVI